MDCGESSDSLTPPSVVEAAVASSLNLLPIKSQKRYEICYNQFMDWRKTKKISSLFSENVFMAYFGELATKIKPSSLWSQYSMLRTTISIHHDVNIAQYLKLKALLKRNSDGYQPKKSKTSTTEEINKFLHGALDDIYLFDKVALIFGLTGACRKAELCNLKIEDITDLGSAILVNMNDTKTKKPRSFTIRGEFYTTYKKYAALRPSNIPNGRLFLNYQSKKCTRQPVGVSKFGSLPQKIAKYLNLQNPELYTGHCFRRSSATILVDGGRDITTLKRHGGWQSTAVAESYLDESVANKNVVADKIMYSVTGTGSSTIHLPKQQTQSNNTNTSIPQINFSNCSNNNITINVTTNVDK